MNNNYSADDVILEEVSDNLVTIRKMVLHKYKAFNLYLYLGVRSFTHVTITIMMAVVKMNTKHLFIL